MLDTILITGGSGFIGTHLTRALYGKVGRILLLDNFLPQVHSGNTEFSGELRGMADCISGDVRDIEVWKSLAHRYPNIEAVIHLAALTGTGQSMYALKEYDSVNSGGTATMLEALLDKRNSSNSFHNLKHVVLASSRAIYGEGAYQCPIHTDAPLVYPPQRSGEQLMRQQWNFPCPICGHDMVSVPTPESAPAQPTSFYGVTKLVQEQYVRTMLTSTGLRYTILRFQNVFGPGQSLKNPYTGVIGVFYSQIRAGMPLDIYEDGEITRDFVYVTDVVSALINAVIEQISGIFNIGSGQSTRLWDVAKWLCEALAKDVPIGCSNAYRVGDIRHNTADMQLAKTILGYIPQVSVRDGLRQYVKWATQETPLNQDAIHAATAALQAAGLAKI